MKINFKIKFSSLSGILIFISLGTMGFTNLQGILPISTTMILLLLSFFLMFISLMKKGVLPVNLFSAISSLIVIIISAVINYVFFDFQTLLLFFLILVISLTFYWYIRYSDVFEVVRKYFKLCYFLSFIAFTQQFAWIIKFKFLYDYSLTGLFCKVNLDEHSFFFRVYGLSTEPAHFAILLTPAVFIAIRRLFFKGVDSSFLNRSFSKNKSIVIISAFLMTFSLSGYVSLLIIILFLTFQKSSFKRVFFSILVILVMLILMFQIPGIKTRVASIYIKNETLASNGGNLSTFDIVSNALVAKDAFLDHPLIGKGLNTHRISYDQYIGRYFKNIYFVLNKEGGSSMYLRIVSEFGMIGVIGILFFFMKYRIRFVLNNELKLFNDMALISLLTCTLRMGGYLEPWLWFLVAVYILSFQVNKKKMIANI
jgi:hypothetical protein